MTDHPQHSRPAWLEIALAISGEARLWSEQARKWALIAFLVWAVSSGVAPTAVQALVKLIVP